VSALVHYDFNDLAALYEQLDPVVLDRAVTSAVNKTQRKVRTRFRLEARKLYNVKAGAINRRVKLTPAKLQKKDAVLTYLGPRIGLVNFSSKPKVVRTIDRRGRKIKRVGVTVKVRRDSPRKFVSSVPGFIARGRSDNIHVFARTSGKRQSLKARYSLSIPQMIGNPEIINTVLTLAKTELPNEFDHAMNYFMGKLTK
jgi:Prophage minor tail protein Z (GPZ)